ncbi:MAG: hypothetical protein IJA81_01830 [Akkermansia sp.]|nr:hypothetical protein [Akkermansia sp.]
MSYQFISECGENGQAKTLAVSPGVEPEILSAVTSLSNKLCGLTNGSAAVHFCYHIVGCYHVLTALSIKIHHLILTPEEVEALQKNSTRPTPAGIIVALNNIRFWQHSAESSNDIVPGEPRMTASQLPDATTQQAWKELTGHKSNATLLLTPPYNSACIIALPQHISVDRFLLLLNESTWLSASRGWGRTFRTFSATKNEPEAADITVAPIGSTESDTLLPVLTIKSDMRAPAVPASPQSSIVSPGSVTPQPEPESSPSVQAPPFSAEPYKYTEAPDYETFDIRPPLSRRIRSLRYIAGLLLLTFVVYGFVSNFVDIAADPVNDEEVMNTKSHLQIQEFAAIVHKGKPADEQLCRLQKMINPDESEAHKILFESIGVLTGDINEAEGHADNLLYLLTHAQELTLSETELCKYYLMLATQSYPHDEWVAHNTTAAALRRWQVLFRKFPELKAELKKDAELQQHLTPIIQQLH